MIHPEGCLLDKPDMLSRLVGPRILITQLKNRRMRTVAKS
jgi:hypothetical protein